MVNKKTIEKYVSLHNKLNSVNYDLSKIQNQTQQQFEQETNIKGVGQYKLVKSFARNTERQKDVNQYLNKKNIAVSIIPKIVEKEYIPKIVKPMKLPYKNFKAKSRKFSRVQGKKITIKTNPTNFKNDSKILIKEAILKAKAERQQFDNKQIKLEIEGNITPFKDDKKYKEIAKRNVQTKARKKVSTLENYDVNDLETFVDGFIKEYNPEGSFTVSISIINYKI